MVFLEKGILKICRKVEGECPCRSVISIKLLCNFFEIASWHTRKFVAYFQIFRTPFYKNTYGGLFLNISV